MKAAQTSFSSTLNFLGQTALGIAVSPLLPVFGLMWMVSILQKSQTANFPIKSGKQLVSERKSNSRSLYAELSTSDLDITWTGDSCLNGY